MRLLNMVLLLVNSLYLYDDGAWSSQYAWWHIVAMSAALASLVLSEKLLKEKP